MRRRLLSMLLALGLVSSLFVGTVFTASAQTDSGHVDPLVEMIFYPFVPHGEMLDETGPWYGSITIQNMEPHNVQYFLFHDTEFDPDDAIDDFSLAPFASRTFSSSQLGLEEPGAPIVVASVFSAVWEADDIEDVSEGYLRRPKMAGTLKQSSPSALAGFAQSSASHVSIDGHNAIPAQDVAWGALSEFCWALWGVDQCEGSGEYFWQFGGLLDFTDGHSYLPIAQTNSGWNSVIHVSNTDHSQSNAAVTMTFYSTDQTGFASQDFHDVVFNETLNPGETWIFDLKEAGFPDDWVGSAWITSDVGIVANVNRVKPSSDMLVTNTNAPSAWSSVSPDFVGTGFEMYAPLVFRDYNDWNTGISVVNIAEAWNAVDVTFYGPTGDVVGTDSRTIAPQSQEFIHMPAQQDLNLGGETGAGWVGSAMVSSQSFEPFHVAVDQIKYTTGEAMSYLATAAGIRTPDESSIIGFETCWDNTDDFAACWAEFMAFESQFLGMPLVQKGSELTGLGDISGLQFFNADSNDDATVGLFFFQTSGALSAPTKDGWIELPLGALQNGTIYTLTQSEMSQNSVHSALAFVLEGDGQIVGVSNNVNYAAQGDGSVAFNMVNNLGQLRFPSSQQGGGIVLPPSTDGEGSAE